MPVPGLSLVGFMEEQQALTYLPKYCIFEECSSDALRRHWIEARCRLGDPIPDAGIPDVIPLDRDEHGDYLRLVEQSPQFAGVIQNMGQNPDFALVEIDRLLSFQSHVDLRRGKLMEDVLGPSQSTRKLLEVCLPYIVRDVSLVIEEFPASMPPGATAPAIYPAGTVTIRSNDLNLTRVPIPPLIVQPDFTRIAGIAVAPRNPLVQVVQYGGRYYLKNGFHRAVQMRKAQYTHIPCVLLSATDYCQVVDQQGDAILDLPNMDPCNLPTCGHYTQNRAYTVTLRSWTRMAHVTYAVSVFSEDN